MTILLSHTTALEALRTPGLAGRLAAVGLSRKPPPRSAPTPAVLRRTVAHSALLSTLPHPLELLVRRRTRVDGADGGVARRTELSPAEADAGDLAVDLGGDILCASPEHVALQMAAVLGPLELVALLCELMGAYGLAGGRAGGAFFRARPLTTRGRILSHLESVGPVPGADELRRACRVACEGSASPLESRLALELSLRPGLGGHNLEVLSVRAPQEAARARSELLGEKRPADDGGDAGRDEGDAAGGGRSRWSGLLIPTGRLPRGRGARFRGVVITCAGPGPKGARGEGASQAALAPRTPGVFEHVVDPESCRSVRAVDRLAEKVRGEVRLPRIGLSRTEAARRQGLRERLFEDLDRIMG